MTCGMLFCDLRTEVMSGPRRDDSMSQRKALREKPVRCGAWSVGDLYRTAEMSTSSTGVIAGGEAPFPLPVEFDPPMRNQSVDQPSRGRSRAVGRNNNGGVYRRGGDDKGRQAGLTTPAKHVFNSVRRPLPIPIHLATSFVLLPSHALVSSSSRRRALLKSIAQDIDGDWCDWQCQTLLQFIHDTFISCTD